MKVLVIEDDRCLAESLQRGRVREGYSVDLAADGYEGLDKARSGLHDLVLLDLSLPGIDGLEVCRTLRTEGLDTPVLVLTARRGDQGRLPPGPRRRGVSGRAIEPG